MLFSILILLKNDLKESKLKQKLKLSKKVLLNSIKCVSKVLYFASWSAMSLPTSGNFFARKFA